MTLTHGGLFEGYGGTTMAMRMALAALGITDIETRWVTDVPRLTRAQMLSLLGDGVVPQQAAAAYCFLLRHLAQRWALAVAA